jgi:hypothetical protein
VLTSATAALVVAVVPIAAGCDDNDSDTSANATPSASPTPTEETSTAPPPVEEVPATAIPLDGADGDLAGTEAFAIVESAFDAYNAGDMDTWAFWRERGLASGADFAYDLATDSRLDVERCDYRGLADWDVDGSMTGHGFDCEVTLSNQFLRAAGIELEMIYNWVVAEDLQSSDGGSNEDFRLAERMMQEYRDWLAANLPTVESSITYDSSGIPITEDVPLAVEHIDEFVADSDDYPLTEPVPPANYYGGPLEQAG